jgi:hypothetical protein
VFGFTRVRNRGPKKNHEWLCTGLCPCQPLQEPQAARHDQSPDAPSGGVVSPDAAQGFRGGTNPVTAAKSPFACRIRRLHMLPLNGAWSLEYDATVGQTVRFQRDYNGKQPGDPARAAAALLKLASVKEPPLRIVRGIDAFSAVEANDLARSNWGKNGKILATRRSS